MSDIGKNIEIDVKGVHGSGCVSFMIALGKLCAEHGIVSKLNFEGYVPDKKTKIETVLGNLSEAGTTVVINHIQLPKK